MNKVLNKLKFLWVLMPIVVFTLVAILVVNWQSSKANKTFDNTQKVNSLSVNPTKKTKVAYEGVEGKTALEILKEKHKVVTKTETFGELVNTIDGVDGKGPKYWMFYINNKQSEVGAGAYQTKNGDKIEWRLE